MNRKNRDRIFISIRSVLKLVTVHSFIVIYLTIGGYVVVDLFITRRQETVSLTYYGFAVFAVFANICFSYARTFDERNEQVYLRGIGERFLFSASGFLIGSLLNYVVINTSRYFDKLPGPSILSKVCESLGGIFLTFSFFFAATTIHSLLNHLFEKIMLNKDNYEES